MGSSKKERRISSAASHFEASPSGRQDVALQRASRNGIYFFQMALFFIAFGLVCLAFFLLAGSVGFVAVAVASVVALLLVSFTHVAQQWERVVVMRLGRFKCVKGPGIFFTVPLVDYCTMRVDQRIRSTAFGAEETLTADLVPLDVDAVLFWMVHDTEKACTVVDDYELLVLQSSQTILRDAIGRANVAEVTSRREQLDRELKRLLEDKVAPWGVTVLSVEIRDILMPKELQDVMSMEAQAEQKRKARVVLMEAEQDISEMMGGIASAYDQDDKAMQLRQMHLLYEGVKEGRGAVVVPSSWGDSFGEQVGKGIAGE